MKIVRQGRSRQPRNGDYERELKRLQGELAKIQQAYIQKRLRAVVVLEGVDAAGKGGLIRRLAWSMDPRGFQVWPTMAPTSQELAEHYLQRFWRKLPGQGCIAVFDRSWYGRVLVERVEELCAKSEWQRAYKEVGEFERTLVDNNFRLVKIFLKISAAEQLRRLSERLERVDKRWKLTFEDFRNRQHAHHYERAFSDMFRKTSWRFAPWYVVESDHKKWARLAALKILVDELGRGIDLKPLPLDPKLLKLARQELG